MDVLTNLSLHCEEWEKEAKERIEELNKGDDFPAEYDTEYPEYWMGRLELVAELKHLIKVLTE